MDTSGGSGITLNPAALDYIPSVASSSAPQAQSSSATDLTWRFPNVSTRQRTSNVNTLDPETEFLKTFFDSCRSTIVQQEAELKRLNECLDIRNKRVLLLESQVGIAADSLSSRSQVG